MCPGVESVSLALELIEFLQDLQKNGGPLGVCVSRAPEDGDIPLYGRTMEGNGVAARDFQPSGKFGKESDAEASGNQ